MKDYAIQIFAVFLAFMLWVGSLLEDGLVSFVKAYASEHSEVRGTTGEPNSWKCALYCVSAFIAASMIVLLFIQSGHLWVVRLYEPTAVSYPWYSGWLMKLLDLVGGPPPMNSPLTWARVILAVHSAFRPSFQAWYKSLKLEQ